VGVRLPLAADADPSGRSRCFCGEEIDLAFEKHVYAAHMDVA
jgi:hypothetical protein